MLLEALELMQNSGGNEDTFVTDFGVYKVLAILTVYLPFFIATFLLSQEYLGEKIACFAPVNFTGSQEGALGEYCWNNGFWVADDIPLEKSLFTQPHRYYPLFLPLQAVVFLAPVIFWNIMTKARLLAILRGSERFLDDLLAMVNSKGEVNEKKLGRQAVALIKQYHNTCLTAASDSMLGVISLVRITTDVVLSVGGLVVQMSIYDNKEKVYQCRLAHLWPKPIMCTVPILDLLDIVWSLNVGALLIGAMVNLYILYTFFRLYTNQYQPLFYNNLPYGDFDDFNENIEWEDRWIKVSYRLLFDIFQENNPIMTRVYSLVAMQPEDRKLRWRQRLARKKLRREAREQGDALGDPVGELSMVDDIKLDKIMSTSTYLGDDDGWKSKKCDSFRTRKVPVKHGLAALGVTDPKLLKGRGAVTRAVVVINGPDVRDYLVLCIIGVSLALILKYVFIE